MFAKISQELGAAPIRVRRFVGAVVVAGVAVVLACIAGTGLSVGNTWSVLALCIVAAIAEKGSIRVTSTTQESISLLPTLFAAVLFGPLAAAIVGAASMVSDFRSPYLPWAVYTSSRAMTGAAAGVVAHSALSMPLSGVGAIAVATTA